MKRCVSRRTKDIVFWRDGGRCQICKAVLKELQWQCDHRIPLWEGGVNEEENLQSLCANCHCEKSSMESVKRAKVRREERALREAEEAELRRARHGFITDLNQYLYERDDSTKGT